MLTSFFLKKIKKGGIIIILFLKLKGIKKYK